MTWRLWLYALLISLPAAAQDATRYVSDEIPIVLRAGPGADTNPLGSLASGTRLELLETAGAYARVRTADGREGWVAERYLEREPAAHQRLQRAEQNLAEAKQQQAQAQSELAALRVEHDKLLADFARVAESGGSSPAYANLEEEAARLRARVQQLEQEAAAQAAGREQTSADDRRRTLLLGGALVAGGALIALLLAQLWPRRRW